MIRCGSLAASLAALLLGITPAAAEDCRSDLVLALDTSASVDVQEYRLQRQGLARALVDEEIACLLLSGYAPR